MNFAEILNVACTDGAGIEVRRYACPGAPRLVLSHGNGFAIDGYRKFWEPLLPDFEICVFDLRNHGRNSQTPIEQHSIDAMARDHLDVRAAIDAAFGARKTFGLFHSVSSIASIKAAQSHDLRWDGLILFDPPLIAPAGNPLRDMNAKLDEALANFALKRQHQFDSVEELATQYRQRLGRTWIDGAESDMASATTRPAATGGYELCCPGAYEARIYGDNANYDSFEAMASLAQPTFLICADPDAPRALAPAFSGPQAAAKYGFQHVSVASTGHLLQIEKPALVAGHTREFIAQVLQD